jgi:primary-amine oxidase
MAVPGTATTVEETAHPKVPKIQHPLDPLTSDEIVAVSLTVRQYVATQTTVKAIRFIICSLLPPPKKAVLASLGIALTPGGKPEAPRQIIRKAEADLLDVVTGDSYNVVVAFKDQKWEVEALDKLPEGAEPQISVEELNQCEEIVQRDPTVQKLAKDVGILPEQIFADGWAIGYDDRFPKSIRVQQAFLFARLSEHENLYAHPMDFIPIIDSLAEKVIHIDFPPHYNRSAEGAPTLTASSTEPPPLTADSLAASKRERVTPPMKKFDFLPDLLVDEPDHEPRDDVKPLHVVQPEGVSFKMNGHELEWQKWKMHIAFSHREGIALSTITYNDNGEVRPIFYRLSLAEMVVPYGAPEFPHPRKFAFDVGEYGMGTMANELSLGCDCLGQIHYLPGAYVAHNGSAVIIKNVICIHEEDAGVLWKHTDYRPGGRGQTVRSRRLVVSMACTLANYEYIWNYYFYQDGNIELEIRLTGILQVYCSNPNEPNPFGTTVAPGVNAHYHQHIFSIRVDPMIDGLNNSVVETDIVRLQDAPTGSAANFAGNAFITEDKVLKLQSEGAREYNFDTERRWRITNPARKHYSSGRDVSYTIGMKDAATRLIAREDGWAAKRAAFAKKALWVIKDVEDSKGGRMWPAGKYVPQTREEPEDSVGHWTKGDESIENEDVLLYITIGTTHIPRPEDWPVMPVEHLRVTFKPNSFFKANPSMDVPGIKDSHSFPAFPSGISSTNEVINQAGGTSSSRQSCCVNELA